MARLLGSSTLQRETTGQSGSGCRRSRRVRPSVLYRGTRLVEPGGRLIKRASYYWLWLAEGIYTGACWPDAAADLVAASVQLVALRLRSQNLWAREEGRSSV